jgi:hypothetical protein
VEGDALEADADVVPKVTVVTVGEDVPRQDTDVVVACREVTQA